MKPLVVYTYKNCSTCRKATQWLAAAGIAFSEKPIRETPPSPAELKRMLAHQDGNLKKLFNTSGGDYREQKLGERLPGLSEAEAIALLAANGNLVKRPFLLGDGVGLVGFKADDWAAALG